MDMDKAELVLRSLAYQNGLFEKDWRFRLDNHKKKIATYNLTKKIIYLSIFLAKDTDEEIVKKAILDVINKIKQLV